MLHRRKQGRRNGVPKAEIGMNSLIDLTFLLLVTFMLTLPKLEQGVDISLPRAKTDVLPQKENKANVITLDKENHVFLRKAKQKDVAVSLETLEQELKALVAADPDVPVLIRGDESLSYGSVMDVVKIVYNSKVHRMALVTIDK